MTKDDLDRLSHLNATIKKRREEIELLRCRAEKCTPTISFEPKGATSENLRELAICEMCDCELSLSQLIGEVYKLRKHTELN